MRVAKGMYPCNLIRFFTSNAAARFAGGLHLSICGHLVRPRTFLPAQRSESKRHFLRRFFHFRACYMDDVSEPTPVNEESAPA